MKKQNQTDKPESMEASNMANPDRFIKCPSVTKRTGLSRTTIHRWMKDGKFPKSIRLTEKTTVWSLQEVSEWMEKMKLEARQ